MTADDHILPDPAEPIARFFRHEHLPAPLQTISKPFADLAAFVTANLPRSAERTVALRKLLEAKDAAVRASLPEDRTTP